MIWSVLSMVCAAGAAACGVYSLIIQHEIRQAKQREEALLAEGRRIMQADREAGLRSWRA